jgi:ribonuclease P protein component
VTGEIQVDEEIVSSKERPRISKSIPQGKSTANRQFVIYKYNKEDQSHFRVGISVSKKLGNAVTRNRLKRRIRHILMELDDQLAQDVDFIVIARQPIVQMSYQEMKSSMMHVLKLATLLPKNEDSYL